MPKSTQECIREMAIRGCTQREIARDLHVSRNTVAKYLSADLSPEPPVTRAPTSPTMEPYADVVRSWLEADAHAPRKQRHTARRVHVHDRLVDELGFPGSLSTVERFVREWRRSRPPEPSCPAAAATSKSDVRAIRTATRDLPSPPHTVQQ